MSTKQVIVIRRDLKMRRGKECAQAAHASMKVLLDAGYGRGGAVWWSELHEWLNSGFAKICLRVDSEEELDSIIKKAEEAGLPTALIIDSGKTEFHGIPTKTCCAIGPARAEEIDKITGNLKLM